MGMCSKPAANKIENFDESSARIIGIESWVPSMPCGLLVIKMAAKLALLVFLVVTLFSHLVPAKTEKSFDNFLKSDHTNNWAVLVRIKTNDYFAG